MLKEDGSSVKQGGTAEIDFSVPAFDFQMPGLLFLIF